MKRKGMKIFLQLFPKGNNLSLMLSAGKMFTSSQKGSE